MDFDHEFYKQMYYDLRNLTNEELENHFRRHGMWEGRIFSKSFLKHKISRNLEKVNKVKEILDEISNNEQYDIDEKIINIVVRTNNRPVFFKINIDSIKSLNYKNYKVFITYENEDTLNYIKENTVDMNNVTLVEVKKTEDEAFYNNYCNTVLNIIDDGYNMFLDDDDMFIHDNCLRYINRFLKEDRLLCWEYCRADKIIGPVKKQIMKGQITSCGFCYNNKHKGKWVAVRGGDHLFVKDLLDNNEIEVGKIKTILTRSISFNIINGEGLSNDYDELSKDIAEEVLEDIINTTINNLEPEQYKKEDEKERIEDIKDKNIDI